MNHRLVLRPVVAAYGAFSPLASALAAVLCASSTVATGATLQKSFSPTVIFEGGTTDLVLTVTNPAGSPARSDIGISDTLPSGLRVGNPPGVGGTCVNAAAATIASGGGSTISVFNLQVPGGAGVDSSCVVTVHVTNADDQFNMDCGSLPAAFTNGAGNVSVTNLTGTVSSACLTVLERIFADGFD